MPLATVEATARADGEGRRYRCLTARCGAFTAMLPRALVMMIALGLQAQRDFAPRVRQISARGLLPLMLLAARV